MKIVDDEIAEDVKDDLLVKPNFPGTPKLKPRLPTRIGQPDRTVKSEIVFKTASDHAMIALRIPLPIAQQIAIPGGEPARDLHVTLVYLGDSTLIPKKHMGELTKRLKAIASEQTPITGRIQGYGRFNPSPDEDVIWVGLDSPDLPELRHKVLQAVLDSAVEPAGDHGFTPHITLAYVEPGEGEDSLPPDLDVEIKNLCFAMGDQEIVMPLAGKSADEDDKAPQPVLPSETFSTLQGPDKTFGKAGDLDAWAEDKGALMVRADVPGVGAVVVKKGKDVQIGIEGWEGMIRLDDLVNALSRIPHDYIMVGRINAYNPLEAKWVSANELASVFTAELVAEPIFFPADLLVLDGPMDKKPARERFERLRALVPIAGSHVVVPPQVEVGKAQTLDNAVDEVMDWAPSEREKTWQCPGVTVVVADSPYTHGVSPDEVRLQTRVSKAWSDEARAAALEARRSKTFYHGSPTGDLGPDEPHAIHVGTREAAKEALEARIGIPVDGEWDGTRTYGETKLAGQHTIRSRGGYPTGHNTGAPLDRDYYSRDREVRPTFANGQDVRDDMKPDIFPVHIVGDMTNTPETPHSDQKANGLMQGGLKRGNAKRGFYYRNIGEDSGSISAVVPHPSHLERVVTKEFAFGAGPGVATERPGDFGADQRKKPNFLVPEKRDSSKSLSAAQQSELDAETAQIQVNSDQPGAQKPHPFKPAKWTHPNGHPRCLTCGDEEPVGGECQGVQKRETKEPDETPQSGIPKDALPTVKDGGVAGGTFGTAGTSGIIAPQQGIFRKPRRKDEGLNYGAGIPLTLVSTYPRKKPKPSDSRDPGGPLFPSYGRPGDTNLASKDMGSGDIMGGGTGEGDSFSVGSGVVGGHTFRVGTLKDGEIVPDPEHPRVNPYEAIFQRKGVLLGIQRIAKDSYDRQMALKELEQYEEAQRARMSMVGAMLKAEHGIEPDAEITAAILRTVEQDLLNNPKGPDSRKPRRFPDVGEEMGFNDSYDALAKSKFTVAIDFDGTCTINADGTENPKMRKLVEALHEKNVPVTIFTARPADEVEEWLLAHHWPDLPVTNVKSPDFKVMLDDRAVHFDPDMLDVVEAMKPEDLSGFKTWWEKAVPEPPVSKTVDMIEGTKLVVRHIFYGEDLTEARHMLKAHREADASLDAALDKRQYHGIKIGAVEKAVMDKTDKHVELLESEGWDFKANDHDSVVYTDGEGNEMRLHHDGSWIATDAKHVPVASGPDVESLDRTLKARVQKVGWTDEAREAAAETRRRNAQGAQGGTMVASPPLDSVDEWRQTFGQEHGESNKYKVNLQDASGEIFIGPDGQTYSGAPHAVLARVGMNSNVSDAIDAGAVRGRLDGGIVSVELDLHNEKARLNAMGLIRAHGKDSNIYVDQPLETRASTVAFANPGAAGKAMRYIQSEGKDTSESKPSYAEHLGGAGRSEKSVIRWIDREGPPDEARDDHGRWTESGGAGDHPEPGHAFTGHMPEPQGKAVQKYEAELLKRNVGPKGGKGTERMVVLKPDGSVRIDKEGGAKSVPFTGPEITDVLDFPGSVGTHNHPIDGGFSLSPNDVAIAWRMKLAEIRAVGNDYTFSMKPLPGKKWPNQTVMQIAYDNAARPLMAEWKKRSDEEMKGVEVDRTSKDSIRAYNKKAVAFNEKANAVVQHETWLKAAPLLGLHYTRILRKKA